MKWFRRAREGERQPEPADETPLLAQHVSLALNALFYRLKAERRYNVLDLGSANESNVRFYSQFCSKIHIEDFHKTVNSFDFLSTEDGTPLDSVFGYLLPYEKGTQFDIIFGWDLFNYLEPKQFLHLSQHLARFCGRGALLFALLSTRKSIPEEPINFTILDEQTLAYRTTPGFERKCPQYQETDIRHMMPNFRVTNSFLLRNGYKEYLFSCQR